MAGPETTKEKYVPIPYFRKTKDGTPIPKKLQAQKISEFIAENIWKGKEGQGQFKLNEGRINNPEGMKWNVFQFTPEEFDEVIKKLKRSKAAGPDELPNDFYKELDIMNRMYLLKLLNECWMNEEIPEEDINIKY